MAELFKTLGTIKLSSRDLIENQELKFSNQKKDEFFSKAREVWESKTGKTIQVSRIGADIHKMEGEIYNKQNCKVSINNGFFNYSQDQSSEERKVWFMNFADPHLFGFYGGNCFAQDEIQVLEHPLLACVREYLLYPGIEGMKPKTVISKNGNHIPTPFLIENVEQWITVNTNPKSEDGTLYQIYGRNFEIASNKALEAGIKLCEDNNVNNIIAVAAPSGGSDEYTYDQIEEVLTTLLCAYSKAKELSEADNKKCVIHGGNWGCGAFGGNPELMYFAQIFAANVTGVDELILHSVDDDAYDDAVSLFKDLEDEVSLNSVIQTILEEELEWGDSDGN